jgi:hypothetical protein
MCGFLMSVVMAQRGDALAEAAAVQDGSDAGSQGPRSSSAGSTARMNVGKA